jgi:energy-coupling factor transporter ATP-binding protein EcfA2
MAKAIELRGITFAYSEKEVLRGIDLGIEEGEFVALLGPIACGKTTLLTVMDGLIPHAVGGKFEGSAQLMGKDTRKTPMRELARHAGLLFQDADSQIFSLSVRDEVEFALRNFGFREDEGKRRVGEALSLLSLEHLADANPGELSQGQKQKVALASILAYGPDVLLLDEPAASLDHRSAEEVYALVKRLNDEGNTVVAVEHDTELIAEGADRLLVMQEGRIVVDGGPEEVFAQDISKYGIREPCSFRMAKLRGLK